MSTKWTNEQREAIFTKNCNLLVAAGAGAGKTAVLVERIIQRIIDDKGNVDIDNLLVVTFTNAAAAEMRERIAEAITRELELRPESKKLQRQLTLLNQANIMTIHSFCLQVIRNNFHSIDLDPSFRVADNTETILLKQEAIDELFEEKYEITDNTGFLRLVDSYGGKSDLKVQNMVLELYEFAKSTPWPEKWLTEMSENFNVEENFDFGSSKWVDVILEHVKLELEAQKSNMEKAIDIVENAEGIDYYLEPFKTDLDNICSLTHCNSWNELKNKFILLSFDKLPIKRNKDADKTAKEKAKKIRDSVKKKLTEIKDDIFVDSDNIGKNLKELYPMMKSLCQLVVEFDEKYGIKKRERGVVDFSDIEHFCLKILTKDQQEIIEPSDAALEYKQQFEEILIDEYQDSNEVQEVIMNMIANKNDIPNMFMVGDVKQSIYRFRQAKPELFLSKYSSYSEKKGSKERKVKLFKNFRSRPEIINGVNFLFKQIMSKEVGELEYGEDEALISGAEYPKITNNNIVEGDKDSSVIEDCCGGDIELHIVEKKDNEVSVDDQQEVSEYSEENDEDEEEADNIQIEARLVASRINQLIAGEGDKRFKVYDKNTNIYRDVSYKDIVILMRATANWAPTFTEELTKAGIPVFADTSSGYFDAIEIRIMMSLLQVIDNPIQDIPLIAVLRSPIESFLPEELIDIRMVNRDKSFYEAMKAITKEENEETEYRLEHISEELKRKVANFLGKLAKWRKKVLHMTMDEFIWYLYTETGYYGFVGAMPAGNQRQANLRILFQRAKQYEKTSYKGLFNFINFINRLKNSSGDMGSAKILGENEDVVRIMSIHKSKGLEFPVVILTGAGKNFNLMDINKSILFHGELGLGPDYVNTDRRISYPTVVKQVLRKKIKIETLSEEMRILYVAFTRAKEKLIITGMVNNIENSVEKWCEAAGNEDSKVLKYATVNAKSYLDWIGPAIVKHKSGRILRNMVDNEQEIGSFVDDSSKWNIKIWHKEEFKGKSEKEIEDEDIIKELETASSANDFSEYREEVNRRLNWQYKYKYSSNIPAKLSVSELKRRVALIDREDSRDIIGYTALRKPRFMQESKTLSPAEKGSLMHLVMQHLDIKRVSSYQEIKEQVITLVDKEFLTEEETKVININKILKFFGSDLGKRMKAAKNIFREVTFFMELSSTDVYEQLPREIYGEEKVLVQGVIDCYFEEDDKLVLIDYKTDYVEDIESIKDKYSTQIHYYKKALEKITSKTIKNTYLYLFFKDQVEEM